MSWKCFFGHNIKKIDLDLGDLRALQSRFHDRKIVDPIESICCRCGYTRIDFKCVSDPESEYPVIRRCSWDVGSRDIWVAL